MSDQKSNKTKIDDLDLCKFQLLAAYLGMRTQDVKIAKLESELARYRTKEVEEAKDAAQNEVLKFQRWLQQEYQLGPHDIVDYAVGQIKRGNPSAHPNKNQEEIKEEEGAQNKEAKEEEKDT